MENIHGVDVSWLHNTNSRGMLLLSVLFFWGGVVGGVVLREAGMVWRAEAEATVGRVAAEDASKTTDNTGGAGLCSLLRQDSKSYCCKLHSEG
jgi:hypothetical protein